MANKNSATDNQQYFCIQVSRGTCYGSPATQITMDFSADKEKVSAEFSEYPKKKVVLLERAEAEDFLTKIFEIIEKEEVTTDLLSVVSYHAEIEWRNIDFFNAENSGEFKAFSNEWFVDQIEEYIEYEAETPESRARFQEILDQKPHRHALEIYRAVKGFARKYLM